MNLAELLATKRVIITCGSGGVGKTSVSATMGLMAAKLGKKALVMTIDPARRLATALGMGLEENVEVRVDPAALADAGADVPGEFSAMMLNAKKTFDGVVDRYAVSDEARQIIFNNPVYRHGSVALIESPEYMGMEKLHELYFERDYDVIIIDTPPLKHALDFLTAPARLKGILSENPMIQMLVRAFRDNQGKSGFWRNLGKRSIFGVLSMVTGRKAIEDAVEFFGLASSFMGGYSERSTAVEKLFRSDECSIVIVTSANLITVEEALFLLGKVRGYGMGFGGFVVNRVQPDHLGELAPYFDAQSLSDRAAKAAGEVDLPEALIQTLVENARYQLSRRTTEQKNVALLARELAPEQFLCEVPELPADVADLKGLVGLLGWLETSTPAHALPDQKTRK